MKNPDIFKSKNPVLNWQYEEDSSIKEAYCTSLLDYVRRAASLPENMELLSAKNVRKLKNFTRLRYGVYSLLEFLTPLALLLFIVSLFFFIKTGLTYLVTTCGVLLGLSLISFYFKSRLSADSRTHKLQYYLNSELNDQQRNALKKAMKYLITEESKIYVKTNYAVMKALPHYAWTAENWFLLFSEKQTDRRYIWLEKDYPRGKLYLQNKTEFQSPVHDSQTVVNPQHEQADNEKPKHCAFTQDLFPQKKKLGDMIDLIEEKCDPRSIEETYKLYRNRPYWLEALKKLHEHHNTYLNYRTGELNNQQAKDFENLFLPIFAKAATNSKNEGLDGSEKFLRGKNDNLDKWLEELHKENFV